jgi:hypothetical protein
MSMYRAYLADSGSIALSGTSSIPYLYFAPPSTADANIFKIKMMIPGASGASPANNADVIGALYVVTGTVGNNSAITPHQIAGNVVAATTVVDVTSSSAGLSGLTTSGQPLWVGDVPQTSGASWADDDPNTGSEIALLPSTKYAFYAVSAAGAGTDMSVRFAVSWAE